MKSSFVKFRSVVLGIGICLVGGTSLVFAQSQSRAEPLGITSFGGALSNPPHAIGLGRYVSPFCGTTAGGDLFPGAVAPFGMIQWSPDTGKGRLSGGYDYRERTIRGFSLDHLSGAGCPYGEDFSFMPVLGGVTTSPAGRRAAFLTRFGHSEEEAFPGYYKVTLADGIRVELTATERSGFGRFTYAGNGAATMVINAASAVNGTKQCAIQIHPAQREITGWTISGHFCGGPDETKVYLCAYFNRPFAAYGTWSGNTLKAGSNQGHGRAAGAFLTFNTATNMTVLVKVAISYVSVADARANLEKESPLSAFSSVDFDRAVIQAGQTWNSYLDRIEVSGGTTSEVKTFYSMLYHAMLGPTVCSDVNGKYRGYDGQVHQTTDHRVQYANFSGWDIYRSESQLLAMLVPRRASDMAQSLLLDYEQGGAFPRWGVPNEDSGVMMGDPAAPIIADFYAFGATNFDTHAALAGLVRAAKDPSVWAPRTHTYERDALADYRKLGYVPEHQRGGYGNVSMTLEYDSADFALSRFAKALGDQTDSRWLLRQAQNWKHLFNPKTGYIQMRRRDGSWAPGFKNNVQRYDGDQAYVEGSASQYLWMVPFNLKGLAAKMGGRRVALQRLNTFFTELNAGTDSPYAYLGNEPCLETPWEFCFWGEPCQTQAVVRQAMLQLFSAKPKGYPGNDDLGEMSSWYVFGALGMYPELPGSNVLVLGSPLFGRALVRLRGGNVLIMGRGATPQALYVHHLSVNGQTWDKPWLRYSQIAHGARLLYTLSQTPDLKWGSRPQDAPPSYGG